jgi:predicted TIM-barrel fold metal-dependent hydrolase
MHPDGMPGWDVAEHLDLMDQCGIATSILSISSPGVSFGRRGDARALARHVNDAGAAICRDHPTRFGHCASLPLPDVDAVLNELENATSQLASDGVTIETNIGAAISATRATSRCSPS